MKTSEDISTKIVQGVSEQIREMISDTAAWIPDGIKNHKMRIVAGLVLLAVELFLFFGTGVLLEDEDHYLTGEGAWDIELTPENPGVCQEFVPAFRHLETVSFRMDMYQAVHGNGEVTVRIEDEGHQLLFEQRIPFYDIVNCAYTDVDVDLDLTRNRPYYLTVEAQTAYEGENPFISACSMDYVLPESRQLMFADVLEGQQLVSRYQYSNALTGSRMRNAVFLSIVTALAVMFGLPDNKKLRRIAGIVILLATPCILGSRLELLNYDPAFYLPFAMKWNVAIMYGLELIVLLITHSPAFATIFTNILLTVLYSANYFMRMYRGTSLRMNDFTAIGTATKVAGAYDLSPNSHLTMAWAILFLIIVICLQTVGKRSQVRSWGRRIASYAVTIAIAVGMLWFGGYKLLYTDYLNQVGFADKGIRGFTYELIYSFDGYLVATCIEVQNARITAPQGYSVRQVESILTDATEAAAEADAAMAGAVSEADYPHVILIMNESLADLTILDGVELNQDNLPFIRSMKENTMKGYVNASVFGGGTANSEFEVFTGCSMAFFSVNYYPYQQAITKPLDSMVSRMKESGYTTISMHPERPGNWNRENVYRDYGFDKSLWREDFPDAEIIHSGVSDAETFHKIIDLYENRQAGEKLFVFDLTMQNHGGYTMHEEPYAVQALNVHQAQVDQYLSLVKISDAAFEELVEYFEQQDEKVIICMYGDHQPWVSDFLVAEELRDGNAASEEILKKYKTPVVIWANYDIEEADDINISMNYLGGLLMRTAGVPMSPFFAYLEQLRQEYPILTTNGYVDAQGVYGGWSGDNDEFPEYRMLQYNYLFDDDTVAWGF